MGTDRIEIGAKEELQNMILEGKLQNKTIFAMGNVVNIADLNDILHQYQMQIEAIVDNDPRKEGMCRFNGVSYQIISADKFFQQRDKKSVLLIYSVRFWREMKDQMVSNGLKEYTDFYVLESLTPVKKERYVRKGYALIQKIREQYGSDAYLLLFYGPLGDHYLFSLFYKQYLLENHIENCVCLGTSAAKKICELFNWEQFELLDKEEFLAVEYTYMFLGEALKGVKILQIWEFVFHFNRCRIRLDRRFSFMDTYREHVYCLKKYRDPICPVFCTDEKEIEAAFHRLGLEAGNTVILSPFAYSIPKQPPKSFWRVLTQKLLQRGVSVALNINSQLEENFIEFVPEIEFSINNSVPYLEYAGGFIGMRSGLCDVISSGSCKKIILYPWEDLTSIDYERHRSDKEFGGLEAMGLAYGVIELEFDAKGSPQYWTQLAESIAAQWGKGGNIF